MNWKEQLRKSDEIEKNFMQTLSNVADKVIPNREHNRNQKAFSDATMAQTMKRSQNENQVTEELYREWLKSNPTTFPNGQPTKIGDTDVDYVPRDGTEPSRQTKSMWQMNGGDRQVFSELQRRYPDPKREDFMKQEEPEPQFVDPENQEDEDEKEEIA